MQGKIRHRFRQHRLGGTGALHLYLHLCQAHRVAGIHTNNQSVYPFLRSIHVNGDGGLVIPEGFQGLSHLPGRLAFKTLQPQPVHLTVLNEVGRNGQGSLDIGQLFS